MVCILYRLLVVSATAILITLCSVGGFDAQKVSVLMVSKTFIRNENFLLKHHVKKERVMSLEHSQRYKRKIQTL